MSSESPDASVLIVEDEQDLADLYAVWLADEHDVTAVYGGEEALEAISPETDVVLLDRRLSDQHGDDVLDAIRESDCDPRVAMVTAVEPDFDILDLGLDEYLVKPVSRSELREAVVQLLKRDSYDESVQEFYSIASRLSALEARKPPDALEESEDYQALLAELRTVRDQLSVTLADLGSDDYAAMFRDLGQT